MNTNFLPSLNYGSMKSSGMTTQAPSTKVVSKVILNVNFVMNVSTATMNCMPIAETSMSDVTFVTDNLGTANTSTTLTTMLSKSTSRKPTFCVSTKNAWKRNSSFSRVRWILKDINWKHILTDYPRTLDETLVL